MSTVRDTLCGVAGLGLLVASVGIATAFSVMAGLDVLRKWKEITAASLLSIVCIFSFEYGCEVTHVKTALTEKVYTYLPENPGCFVEGADLTEVLVRELTPNYTRNDLFVGGPHGSGKTTVMVDACRKIGPGVLYIAVSPENVEDFPSELAAALSMNFRCPSTWYMQLLEFLRVVPGNSCSDRMLDWLVKILGVLTEAVLELRADGKHSTLVIDNVSGLLAHGEEGEKVIMKLQDFAKKMADLHVLTVVFSGSEEVYRLMRRRSAASRMVEIAYIRDITPKQALTYIRCIRPHLSRDTAAEIVRLVGGRFALLNHASRLSLSGIWKIKENLFALVSRELEVIGVSLVPCKSDHPLTIATWAVARELFKSQDGNISELMFDSMLAQANVSQEDRYRLQSSNIFEVKGGVVDFQSTLVQSFFSNGFSEENKLCKGEPVRQRV